MTKEEKRAIASLRRLGKRWPGSLWLFSGNGVLYVMRYRDGAVDRTAVTSAGGIDPEYIVATIHDIPNDGGDW